MQCHAWFMVHWVQVSKEEWTAYVASDHYNLMEMLRQDAKLATEQNEKQKEEESKAKGSSTG